MDKILAKVEAGATDEAYSAFLQHNPQALTLIDDRKEAESATLVLISLFSDGKMSMLELFSRIRCSAFCDWLLHCLKDSFRETEHWRQFLETLITTPNSWWLGGSLHSFNSRLVASYFTPEEIQHIVSLRKGNKQKASAVDFLAYLNWDEYWTRIVQSFIIRDRPDYWRAYGEWRKASGNQKGYWNHASTECLKKLIRIIFNSMLEEDRTLLLPLRDSDYKNVTPYLEGNRRPGWNQAFALGNTGKASLYTFDLTVEGGMALRIAGHFSCSHASTKH